MISHAGVHQTNAEIIKCDKEHRISGSIWFFYCFYFLIFRLGSSIFNCRYYYYIISVRQIFVQKFINYISAIGRSPHPRRSRKPIHSRAPSAPGSRFVHPLLLNFIPSFILFYFLLHFTIFVSFQLKFRIEIGYFISTQRVQRVDSATSTCFDPFRSLFLQVAYG